MSRLINGKTLTLALAALALVSCSEQRDPLAPRIEGPVFTHSGAVFHALQYKTPLAHDLSATEVIGRAGGTIDLGPVSLTIPRGALAQNTEITVLVPAGEYVQVRFGPHGLQFRKDADLRVSIKGTLAENNQQLLKNLIVVYVSGDVSSGIVAAQEILPVEVKGKNLHVDLSHFSGYVIATGEGEGE